MYVKHALRSLFKTPSVTAIATLSLAICATCSASTMERLVAQLDLYARGDAPWEVWKRSPNGQAERIGQQGMAGSPRPMAMTRAVQGEQPGGQP